MIGFAIHPPRVALLWEVLSDIQRYQSLLVWVCLLGIALGNWTLQISMGKLHVPCN